MKTNCFKKNFYLPKSVHNQNYLKSNELIINYVNLETTFLKPLNNKVCYIILSDKNIETLMLNIKICLFKNLLLYFENSDISNKLENLTVSQLNNITLPTNVNHNNIKSKRSTNSDSEIESGVYFSTSSSECFSDTESDNLNQSNILKQFLIVL